MQATSNIDSRGLCQSPADRAPVQPVGPPARAQSTSKAAQPRILLTDPEGAELWGVGLRQFLTLQHEPWFPKPVVLGPRLKRHVRHELEAAVQHMPRQAAPGNEPAQLLRGRIERQKRTGLPA